MLQSKHGYHRSTSTLVAGPHQPQRVSVGWKRAKTLANANVGFESLRSEFVLRTMSIQTRPTGRGERSRF